MSRTLQVLHYWTGITVIFFIIFFCQLTLPVHLGSHKCPRLRFKWLFPPHLTPTLASPISQMRSPPLVSSQLFISSDSFFLSSFRLRLAYWMFDLVFGYSLEFTQKKDLVQNSSPDRQAIQLSQNEVLGAISDISLFLSPPPRAITGCFLLPFIPPFNARKIIQKLPS